MKYFTSPQSVQEYLEEIPRFQSSGKSAAKFDLSRFKDFCDAIGNPQKQFTAVHVAGTNGKGSTCNILASVFQQSGYKTGVYMSPHIRLFNERFRVGDHLISDVELVQFFNSYHGEMEAFELSYFEISTAIAFWWFALSNVDIACIEVGLGGRLDATNIIDPAVSVITSIAMDHTNILGDTITEIATEKGGIIKNQRPVVIGDLPTEARSKIIQIAEQKKSNLVTIDNFNPTFIKPGIFQLTVDGQKWNLKSSLIAPVQAKNIAVAWSVCSVLRDKYKITKTDFNKGLRHLNTGFGRFEKLFNGQQWYFDGGHNLEAVRALKKSVATVGNLEDAVLVLSIMRDKITKEVMVEFSEFKNIYYYPLSLERAATFADIKQWLPKAIPFPASEKDREQLFQNGFNSELVIFSGSFYFYETVRDWGSNFVLN